MNFKGSYVFCLNNHNFDLRVNFKMKIGRWSENMLTIENRLKTVKFSGGQNLQKFTKNAKLVIFDK